MFKNITALKDMGLVNEFLSANGFDPEQVLDNVNRLGITPLHAAIIGYTKFDTNGKIILESLLSRGYNPLAKSATGFNAIEFTAVSGVFSAFKIITKIRPDIKISNDTKCELVKLAGSNMGQHSRCKDFITSLVQEGFNINHIHSQHNITPLQALSCQNISVNVISFMLELGANPLLTIKDGPNVIELSAVIGDIPAFDTYMQHLPSKDRYSSNDAKFNLIVLASKSIDDSQQHKNFIKHIIESGFPVDYKHTQHSNTLLMCAALSDSPHFLKYLLELGADVTTTLLSSDNKNVAQIVAAHGYIESFKVIFEYAPDLATLSTEKNPCPPFMAAMMNLENNKQQIEKFMHYLVSQGYPIDHPTYRGDSALMIAVMNNKLPAAKLLIELGADVNYRNPLTLDTPFIASCDAGNYEAAIYLVLHPTFDATKHTGHAGMSIAHYAVTHKNVQLLHEICTKYPDLIMKCENNDLSPIDIAIFCWIGANNESIKTMWEHIISELTLHGATARDAAHHVLNVNHLLTEFYEISSHSNEYHNPATVRELSELLGDTDIE